ncbi:response regulator [Nostocales cyanobacterium LEGE 11386]|nr:response regulator [Nostocales cyanobacterium LEGE 11386]
MNLHTEEINPIKSILVCDDIEDMVFLIKTALESEGYAVETANCGNLALAKIQTKQPDLLITNLMMPDMNGYELISHVREDLKLNHLPILVVSAAKEQSPNYQDIAGFIGKPFQIDELIEKVNSILE